MIDDCCFKIRYSLNQKDWCFNMRKHIINYQHMSEASLKFIHMRKKCRLDRNGGISKIWSYRL